MHNDILKCPITKCCAHEDKLFLSHSFTQDESGLMVKCIHCNKEFYLMEVKKHVNDCSSKPKRSSVRCFLFCSHWKSFSLAVIGENWIK